jgi:hypothetical protein
MISADRFELQIHAAVRPRAIFGMQVRVMLGSSRECLS